MRLSVVCLVAVAALSAPGIAAPPKPWQWTTAQAIAAIMRQAEGFYVETTDAGYRFPRDLTTTKCRGTGTSVASRFVTFTCVATYQRGVADPAGTVRVVAKTRRAGGLCWAVSPAPIPSGCLAPGTRSSGSRAEVGRLVYARFGAPAQEFTVVPHGSGFYSWRWISGAVERRGTVTFTPRPVLKLLS